MRITDNFHERFEVMMCALIDTRSKQAVRFDYVHNLLHSVSIPFMNIIVEQLMNGEWRRWRVASASSSTLVFEEQAKSTHVA